MDSFIDVLFPKSCSICKRKGTYLCDRCKKLFKYTLPECYLCRRVSNNYMTHERCRHKSSLDSVFVCWEYNRLTSDLLRKYKYGYVYDLSGLLSNFFVDSLDRTNCKKVINNSLIINIPLSTLRLRDRGFNQTSCLADSVSKHCKTALRDDLLARRISYGHQSGKSREERMELGSNVFYVKNWLDISAFKSVTIVDDVITTGSTLEKACEALRNYYGKDLIVNALCMFRGRPFYSNSDASEDKPKSPGESELNVSSSNPSNSSP